jgi:hypothetical protein
VRLLSILLGIMFPDRFFAEQTMSPELVDEAILASCVSYFRKVARVISDAAKALESSTGATFYLIADRIKVLVAAERLEGAGDLDGWGTSEVRLPQKKAAGVAAETSRRRETSEQGT